MIRFTGEKHLALPTLLIREYQPIIGPLATMIWIDLLFLLEEGVSDWQEPLLVLTNLSLEELEVQLELLKEVELISLSEQEIVIHSPKIREKEEEVAVTVDQSLDDLKKKIEAVYDYFHEKIGLMAAKDFALINEWIEIRGMAPELVAKAIEITSENAQFPSMKYLDGVLKNWYNANVKSLEELEQPKQRPQFYKPETQQRGFSGLNTSKSQGTQDPPMPQYKTVDLDKVRKWKELFKDDYKD